MAFDRKGRAKRNLLWTFNWSLKTERQTPPARERDKKEKDSSGVGPQPKECEAHWD